MTDIKSKISLAPGTLLKASTLKEQLQDKVRRAQYMRDMAVRASPAYKRVLACTEKAAEEQRLDVTVEDILSAEMDGLLRVFRADGLRAEARGETAIFRSWR